MSTDPHGDACPCADCKPVAQAIDLAAARAARDAPDPAFVTSDDYGRKLFAFLLSYTMGGSSWSATIWAYDADDAEARVAAMRESLTFDGQIHSIVDA